LAIGTYRVIAVRDEYKNLLYDPQTDEYGMMNSDISFTPKRSLVTGVQFRMTKEDTTPPFLSSATAPDLSHILLKFSEAILKRPDDSVSITVIDTVHQHALSVLDFSLDEASPTETHVVTAIQESTAAYRVEMTGIRDMHGNSINPRLNSAVFSSSTIPDTVKPKIELVGFPDSSKNVQIDDSIHCVFTEAVLRGPLEHGFSLTDTAKKNVQGSFVWKSSLSLFFIPKERFNLGQWYTIKVVMDSLKDYAGNGYHDSVWTKHFKMTEEKSLSSIQGKVVDADSGVQGSVHILATDISKGNAKPREVVIDAPGAFEFSFLPEGRYTLSAYRDADGDNKYSYGKPFPLRRAERFSLPSDTLKVRARWPLEGVVIKIP
jgi:hypothetical protein